MEWTRAECCGVFRALLLNISFPYQICKDGILDHYSKEEPETKHNMKLDMFKQIANFLSIGNVPSNLPIK